MTLPRKSSLLLAMPARWLVSWSIRTSPSPLSSGFVSSRLRVSVPAEQRGMQRFHLMRQGDVQLDVLAARGYAVARVFLRFQHARKALPEPLGQVRLQQSRQLVR